MSNELKNKVIITAALTGAVTPKELNEAIPLTPQEIADDAYKCWKAGASVVHLHMRDEQGLGTMERDRFKETIDLLRAYEDCDVVICATSSGSMKPMTEEERMEHFRTIPEIELGSYDAGSMNFGGTFLFDNNPQFLDKLGRTYAEFNVKPELEIFDMGMLSNVEFHVKQGTLQGPLYYQLVLGVIGGMKATVENLVYLRNHLPEGAVWSAFGIGAGHMPIMYATIAQGGHVRVGLEDNVFYSKGVKATNVMLVERAVRAVEVFGKEVATSVEAREILGLKQLER
jgi:uncharacterized protein (DUF849 family)